MNAGYETILVPYDFSSHARRALEVALDLAKRLDAKLHLAYVVQPPLIAMPASAMGAAPQPVAELDAGRREAEAQLAEVSGRIDPPKKGLEAHVVTLDSADRALCALAEKLDADLIVMGSHGRTGIAHVFLGSVTERTLRRAPCPVLAVRAEDEESSGEGPS